MTRADAAFVSTGSLPGPVEVARLVEEAHRRFGPVQAGEVSDVYPALRTAPKPQARRLERIADAFFLFALTVMVAVGGLIAYEII